MSEPTILKYITGRVARAIAVVLPHEGGPSKLRLGGALGVQWHTLSLVRRCPLEYTIIIVFPKNKKANLTKAERNALKKRADDIFDSYQR